MTKQILVVDDDPLTAKLMKGRLEAPGNPTDMRAAEAAEFIADRHAGIEFQLKDKCSPRLWTR